MDRIVLFRFHKNPRICAQKIDIINHLNPDTKIIGLGDNIEGIELMYDAGMEDLYSLDHREGRWCWLNGDLAMIEWYRNRGNQLDFDMLHLIEWDLLLTKPLDVLYEGIESVGLTGKISIRKAREMEWDWVTGKMSHDYEYLCDKIGLESSEGYGCVLPGCCFSRDFVEYVTHTDFPNLCNDEARIGALSAASNYDVSDTGFFDWDNERSSYFNCYNLEVSNEEIKNERDAFHPHRSIIQNPSEVIDSEKF